MRNPKGAGRKPKLTPLEQSTIYSLYVNKFPVYLIAHKYGISERTVNRIVNKFRNNN